MVNVYDCTESPVLCVVAFIAVVTALLSCGTSIISVLPYEWCGDIAKWATLVTSVALGLNAIVEAWHKYVAYKDMHMGMFLADEVPHGQQDVAKNILLGSRTIPMAANAIDDITKKTIRHFD